MVPSSPSQQSSTRRGAVLVLAAGCLVLVFAMVAFSIDAAYISMVATELQGAADASALAGIARMANGEEAVISEIQATALANEVANKPAVIAASDIEFGRFETANKTFTPGNANANSIRVTARATNEGLFFAPVIGRKTFTLQRSAVAMLNPRDICFVVDLSGSMNDDTDPCWATGLIENKLAPQGYSGVANSMMQDVFTDFGYGTYPGTTQYIGSPLSITANNYAYAELTKDNGKLTATSIATTYRISNSDTEATRKTKAYKWMIDKQIAVVMPAAKPVPNSSNTTSFNYWSAYLDYIIESRSVSGSGTGMPRKGSTSSVTVPPSQDSDRIDGFNNPNTASFPSGSVNLPRAWRNKIGYITYVQFMMDWGRDRSPDADNSNNAFPNIGTKTPLSTLSPHCPWHTEATAGGDFDFPPREQPTHAVRRSLIAALQTIKEKNQGLAVGTGDWVSIVSFDAIDSAHAPTVQYSLAADYQAAMQACTSLQAVADLTSSTATENGLILGQQHLAANGRNFADKVMVLLTDGMPNIYSSSNATINSYITQNPSGEYYSSGNSAYNAAIMQASKIRNNRDKMFAVGMGLGSDMSFMDRLSRMAGTAENGQSPRGAGNPADYEERLTEIFNQIINTRGGKLVR